MFKQEPINVVPRFTADAADDAARWQFHSAQNTTLETDGSLTVRFRVGGWQELRNHLFRWGTAVMVIEPDELRLYLAELAEMVGRHHGVQHK